MSKVSSQASTIVKASSQNGRDKWGSPEVLQKKGGLRWTDCGAEDLLECIGAVTEDGCAILCAKTSDGGALVIQVLSDNHKPKWYSADMATLNANLLEITELAKG